MEFWSTIAGLAKRKWVIIPALLAAVSLGAFAYFSTPLRYVSSTTMVLTTNAYGGVESQDPNAPTNLTNPLLSFNDALTTASAILIQTMGTRQVAHTLGAQGATTFTVNDGRTNPNLLGLDGPFVYMVAESTSPARARAVVTQARQMVNEKLQYWQSTLRAPQKTYLSLADVVPPSSATPVRSKRTKIGLLGAIAGFVLVMGSAYSWERVKGARPGSRGAVGLAQPGGSWTFANRSKRERGQRPASPPPWVRAVTEDEVVASPVFPTSRAAGSGNP